MPEMQVIERRMQEDYEFKDSLGYIYQDSVIPPPTSKKKSERKMKIFRIFPGGTFTSNNSRLSFSLGL